MGSNITLQKMHTHTRAHARTHTHTQCDHTHTHTQCDHTHTHTVQTDNVWHYKISIKKIIKKTSDRKIYTLWHSHGKRITTSDGRQFARVEGLDQGWSSVLWLLLVAQLTKLVRAERVALALNCETTIKVFGSMQFKVQVQRPIIFLTPLVSVGWELSG